MTLLFRKFWPNAHFSLAQNLCTLAQNIVKDKHFESDLCDAESATKRWVEQIVIGMKLCPWASSVKQKGALRYKVSSAHTVESLLQDAEFEIGYLEQGLLADVASNPAYPRPPETTLLIVDTPAKSEFLRDFRSSYEKIAF
jgi:hypothetical protein